MKYTFTLRDTRTGHIAEYCHPCEYQKEEDVLFDWGEDGNMGCDCNRMSCLYENALEEECKCGEGTIELLKIRDENGKMIYDKNKP